MATDSAKAPVLNGPKDWYDWLDYIKDLATTKRVWNYVNPDLETVPDLLEPSIPSVEDVRPTQEGMAVATVIDLNDEEKQALSIL